MKEKDEMELRRKQNFKAATIALVAGIILVVVLWLTLEGYNFIIALFSVAGLLYLIEIFFASKWRRKDK